MDFHISLQTLDTRLKARGRGSPGLLNPESCVSRSVSRRSKNDRSSIQNSKSLHATCQEFESVFIAHLLKTMRKTVPKADVMPHESLCEDVYRSMMDEALANAVARGSGVGLAEILYRQLSRSKKD